MSDDNEDLKHLLYQDYAFYLRLSHPLSFEEFQEIVSRLVPVAAHRPGDEAVRRHWESLLARREGRSWRDVVARFRGNVLKPGAMLERMRSLHTIDNLVARCGYVLLPLPDFDCTIDFFNPRNELRLPYQGAGEPVLTLLMRERESGVKNRLMSYPDIYDRVEMIDEVVTARETCATSFWFTVAQAYHTGRLSHQCEPWDLLFELTVASRESLPSPSVLETHFSYVREFPRGRVLLQICPGLQSVLIPDMPEAAQAIGRTSVHELVPGAYDRPPSSLNRFLRGRDS